MAVLDLNSFAGGKWVAPSGTLRPIHSAVTGKQIASAGSDGLDFGGMIDFAVQVGGPALREMTFHERAKKLKALAKVLRKNSELTLGIEGTADRQMDWPKMSGKQAKKEKKVGKQKDAKTQQKGLAKDQAVDEDQLKKLALMRANEVKKYMMRWRRVPAERIQLKPARIISTTNKEYGQVELSLTVMNGGSGQSK